MEASGWGAPIALPLMVMSAATGERERRRAMKEIKKSLSGRREKRNGTGVATSVRFASATAATLFGSHLFIHHFPLSLSIRFSYFYYWNKNNSSLIHSTPVPPNLTRK
jgi:hypothetical protein